MPDAEKKITDLISKIQEKGLIPEKRQEGTKAPSQQRQSMTGDGDFRGQAGHDLNVNVGRDLNVNHRPIIQGPSIIACPKCNNPVAYDAVSCPACGTPVADLLRQSQNRSEYNRLTKRLIILFAALCGIGGLASVFPVSIREYLHYGIIAGGFFIVAGIYRLRFLERDM